MPDDVSPVISIRCVQMVAPSVVSCSGSSCQPLFEEVVVHVLVVRPCCVFDASHSVGVYTAEPIQGAQTKRVIDVPLRTETQQYVTTAYPMSVH